MCLLSQEQLTDTVIKMRERGRKATGCNATIRAINTYMHWSAGEKRKCGAGCEHPRIQELKEPQEVLPTFTEAQIKRLIVAKPKGKFHRRTHVLVLFLLDTGCRISKALGVRVADVDFDNLLVTLDGKGQKQRIVPFSFELRRVLYLHCKECPTTCLSFASRIRTQLGAGISYSPAQIVTISNTTSSATIYPANSKKNRQQVHVRAL